MKNSPAFLRRFNYLNLFQFKSFSGITGISCSRLAAIILFAVLCITSTLSANQFSIEQVFEAVEGNDIDTVRSALNSGFDVNATKDDSTLLGWALFRDLEQHPKRDIIRLIVQSPKIQINKTSTFHIKQNDVEETPLITA